MFHTCNWTPLVCKWSEALAPLTRSFHSDHSCQSRHYPYQSTLFCLKIIPCAFWMDLIFFFTKMENSARQKWSYFELRISWNSCFSWQTFSPCAVCIDVGLQNIPLEKYFKIFYLWYSTWKIQNILFVIFHLKIFQNISPVIFHLKNSKYPTFDIPFKEYFKILVIFHVK